MNLDKSSFSTTVYLAGSFVFRKSPGNAHGWFYLCFVTSALV